MCHYRVPAEWWCAEPGGGGGEEGHYHPWSGGRVDLHPLICAVSYCKCWTGQRHQEEGGGGGGRDTCTCVRVEKPRPHVHLCVYACKCVNVRQGTRSSPCSADSHRKLSSRRGELERCDASAWEEGRCHVAASLPTASSTPLLCFAAPFCHTPSVPLAAASEVDREGGLPVLLVPFGECDA